MAWWATKRRYLPYIDGVVGNKKTLPTRHKRNVELIFRQKFRSAKLLPETDFHAKVLRAKLLRGTDN
ncbi:MAG: hypothetical protein DRR00_05920 [Candidatus Parabeggiatoa sp. nov. 3]|nr:MAG: hypothetical protein DRR00_05920 [Gammaproteobacteria bacterium]